MAARSRKIRHDDETRAKIQAAMIINRLQDCVAGAIDMTPSQVSAAKVLINKVLPDLSAVSLSGDEDNPVSVRTIVTGVPRDGDN